LAVHGARVTGQHPPVLAVGASLELQLSLVGKLPALLHFARHRPADKEQANQGSRADDPPDVLDDQADGKNQHDDSYEPGPSVCLRSSPRCHELRVRTATDI
jgi:hypothetical protein